MSSFQIPKYPLLITIPAATGKVPTEMRFEQEGAGDDIRVKFSDGSFLEIQVKHGLKVDQ